MKKIVLFIGTCFLLPIWLYADPVQTNGLNYNHLAFGQTTQQVSNTSGQATYVGHSWELHYLASEHVFLMVGEDLTSKINSDSQDQFQKNKMGIGYRHPISEGTDFVSMATHSDASFTHFAGTTDFGLRAGFKSVAMWPGAETHAA